MAHTTYKPEYDKKVYQLCLLGADDKKLAKLLGCSVSSLYKWRENHPSFSEAIESGKDIADSKVASALFNKAIGYTHPDIHISNNKGEITITPYVKHYAPDTAACAIWLTNRQRDKWRHKQEINVTGDLDIKQLSDEELKNIVQKKMRELDVPLKVVG